MKRILSGLAAMLMAATLSANNIQISNATLTGDNATGQYVMVRFDLSWDNSWRITNGPANRDAAWVFVKYRLRNDTLWHHATLHYVDGTGSGDGHIAAPGATIASSDDNGAGGAYGVFIYHSTTMNQGSVSYPGTALRWDYGVDGVTSSDSVSDVEVFGIEMVYVPQGSFEAGTGGTSEVDAFYTYPDATQPYTISSEAAIPVGTTTGDLYYQNSTGSSGDQSGPIPAAFPKGYQAFYIMKYEITQEQYVTFLNTLTPDQVVNRTLNGTLRGSNQTPISANRMGIHSTAGNNADTGPFFTDAPQVPCGWLLFDDIAAYCDWAGLRPVSELEYEKACRGPVTPVQGEFAWGTTGIDSLPYKLSNLNAADEAVDSNYSQGGNAKWYKTNNTTIPTQVGPVRAGIFAANTATTGRETAGAGYYGIMELTGNEWEAVISVGEPIGRTFNGKAGDGILATDGYSNEGWPNWVDAANQGGISTGGGYRGGGNLVYSDKHYYMVSDRSIAAYMFLQAMQLADYGGRGARTAP